VKKLLVILLVLGACRSRPAGDPLTGAPAPRLAVEQFLAAIKAQDLQAMSVIWGTDKGPARDQVERTELEKREIIMAGCFDHDKFRIVDESPGEGGRRVFRVEITKGTITRVPRFYAVQGPSDRWYVEDAEIAAVRDICRTKPDAD
jgi:hypothetical protein